MDVPGLELYHRAEERKITRGLLYDLVEGDPVTEWCGESKLGEQRGKLCFSF